MKIVVLDVDNLQYYFQGLLGLILPMRRYFILKKQHATPENGIT